MTSQVYKDMLHVMTKRGGPYTGLEFPEFYPLVQELFTPEEAELNNVLPRTPVTAAEIAKEKGKNEAEVTALLEGMANKGLCVSFRSDLSGSLPCSGLEDGGWKRAGRKPRPLLRVCHVCCGV